MMSLNMSFPRLFFSFLIIVASPFAYPQTQERFDLVELVPALAELETGEANRATLAQQEAGARMAEQQDRISRWNVVTVKDLGSIVDRQSDTPRRRISLTIFPGVSFVVEHTRHRIGDWDTSWYGEIVEGGSGTVRISIVPDDDNAPSALVSILTDRGDFNIAPTEARPYYIAVEMNPLLIEPVD